MQPFWYFKYEVAPCPSGEQIIGGLFEDATLVGWTAVNANISTAYAHTGEQSCFIYSGYIQQQTDLNIEQRCIDTFDFYAYAPYGNATGSYKIYYTDGTDSGNISLPNITSGWTHINVKPNVTVGKTVKNIRITIGTMNPAFIDDVSCKGTG